MRLPLARPSLHSYLGAMCEPAKPPTISAVVTVYNKAPFLADTIRSLRRQAEDEGDVEYVFVDDASSDASVDVIKQCLDGAPHVRIIANADNRGPSVRLNQGAAAAAGDFLYFLDGDDIATKGAMLGMLRLLRREDAELIYGKTIKRVPGAALLDVTADPDAGYRISTAPLETVLGGGFVRMTLMCRRDLFLEAGGADETIFIQDESLPLRLAAKAKRLIDWQATVIAMPVVEGAVGKVSENRNQLRHDAFLANLHAIEETCASHPDLSAKLYARTVSAYWKFAKRQPGIGWLKPGFWRYLETKCLKPPLRSDVLAWMETELSYAAGVRRMPTTRVAGSDAFTLSSATTREAP
ncbi:MAG: glycosyltransferase family 2 protein [Alphaproteobacteria bacterium]